MLLNKVGTDPNRVLHHCTPLDEAAMEGHEAVVRLFLKNNKVNVDYGDTDKNGANVFASRNGHHGIAELITAESAFRRSEEPNVVGSAGQTRLMRAIEAEGREVIASLLAHPQLDPNITDQESRTALFYAARANDVDTIQNLLFKANLQHNTTTPAGATPLYIAAQKGHAAAIRALTAHRLTDVNLPLHKTAATPLFTAAANGHTLAASALLECSATDCNARTKDGATPLYIAARNGHVDVIQILLEHEDLDLVAGFGGESPLNSAERSGNTAIADLLREAGAARDPYCPNNYDVHGRTALMNAINHGDADKVGKMLSDQGLEPNLTDANGLTALHHAARQGNMTVLRSLLAMDATDVDVTSADGESPLHLAVHDNQLLATCVLANRADLNINLALPTGDTALTIAASNGSHGIVKTLLAHPGIDYHHATRAGVTALHAAARNGHIEVVRTLSSLRNIDLGKKSCTGADAATEARNRGHKGIAFMLHTLQSSTALERGTPMPFFGKQIDVMALKSKDEAAAAVVAWRAADVPENDLQQLRSDIDDYVRWPSLGQPSAANAGRMTPKLFNKRYEKFFAPKIAIEDTSAGARKKIVWLQFGLKPPAEYA